MINAIKSALLEACLNGLEEISDAMISVVLLI